jgi:hypothetical protein
MDISGLLNGLLGLSVTVGLEPVREGRQWGLISNTAGFLESLYVLTSLPLPQRSLRPRMGDPCPAHPTR